MFSFDNLLQVHSRATILVPSSIVTLLNSILGGLANKGSEYGIYLKGTLNKQTMTMTLSEEYMIPKQEVTSVTIDFKEDPPSTDWNVVLHRHPDGVTRFSGTDVSSINKEFDASLLFIPPFDFPQAIMNVDIGDGVLLQLPANVVQICGGKPVDVSMIVQKREAFMTPAKGKGLPLKRKFKIKPRVDDKLVANEGAFGEFGDKEAEEILALEQEMQLDLEAELDEMHDETIDEDELDDNPLLAHLSDGQ
jgi:proteasome lid subunit RPN8/RPN11